MYQQVWSATFWRSKFIWGTFHLSTSLVCHLLTKSVYLRHLPFINKFGLPPSDEVSVSETPFIYQQVWSATFWRSQCIWDTFHLSTSLVCHLLTKSMYLRHLPCINKFGLPPSDEVSVSETPFIYQQVWSATFLHLSGYWERQRRSMSFFGIGSKGMYISIFEVWNDVHINRILRK